MLMISFDPGETTGYALFRLEEGTNVPIDERASKMLIESGEFTMDERVAQLISKADVVVYEEFRLYPWKAKQKTWSSFPEVEVIGVIKYFAHDYNKPIVGQGADKKKFYDDDKLKRMGVYNKSSRHARDAIRHGYFAIDTSF